MNAFKAKVGAASTSSFLRGVSVVSGGTAAAQVVPVLLTPLLTRLYQPDDLGKLGLYVAFISFATGATTLGYSSAIVAGKSDKEAAGLTAIAGILTIPVSALLSIVLLVLVQRGWLGFGELPGWIFAPMSLSLFFTGLYFTLRSWLLRFEHYGAISFATVGQSLGRVFVQVATGLLGAAWPGLVAGEVAGRALGLGQMWSRSKIDLAENLKGMSLASYRHIAIVYKKFPLLSVPSSLINSLALVLPVPLITTFYSIQESGQFAVASRVMIIPLAFIGASVADVFQARIAAVSRNTPEAAFGLFLKTSMAMLLLGIPPLILVRMFGSDLFQMALGSEWRTSGSIASAIAPWILLQLAVNPVSRLVQVYRGQEFKLVYDFLALISIVGVFTYADSQDLALTSACAILGWSQGAVYAVYWLLLALVLKRNLLINYHTEGD